VRVFLQPEPSLDRSLRSRLQLREVVLAHLPDVGVVGFGHRVLDASDLRQAPKHRVFLQRLACVVPRDRADAAAVLVGLDVLDDWLQHVQGAIHAAIFPNTIHRKVEHLRDGLQLLWGEELISYNSLVLSIVEH